MDRDSPTGGKFYMDGDMVGVFDPTNYTGSLTNASPLRMGRSSVPFIDGFYNGILDEVELFPRVLDATEIHGIFLARSGGKCKCVDRPPDTEHWWPLDEAGGYTAYDIVNPQTDGTYSSLTNPNPWPGMVALSRYFGPPSYVKVSDDASLNYDKSFSMDA